MKVTCPHCASDQLAAYKQGFSIKRAIAGMAWFGGAGILFGASGSNRVKCTCLACGHTFNAGEGLVIYEEGEKPAKGTSVNIRTVHDGWDFSVSRPVLYLFIASIVFAIVHEMFRK